VRKEALGIIQLRLSEPATAAEQIPPDLQLVLPPPRPAVQVLRMNDCRDLLPPTADVHGEGDLIAF
jgi:hypothetical protein